MLGGNFCAWMGLFGSYQCILLYLTNEDNRYNQTIAGGLTGATISLRGGWRSALRGGVSGAIFFGIFGLFEIYMSKSQVKSKCEQDKMKGNLEMYAQLSMLKKNRPELVTLSMEDLHRERDNVVEQIRQVTGEDVSSLIANMEG